MNIITESTVYLVGCQYVDGAELDQFLTDHEVPDWRTDATGPQKLVELGGRLCYLSFAKPRPGGNAEYIKHIKEVGHGSVLEHAVYTVIATGISRSLSHEWVRHRAGMSPSQLSQRYVSEERGEFVIPRELQGDGDTEAVWQRSVTSSWQDYRILVSKVESKLRHRNEFKCKKCNGEGMKWIAGTNDQACGECNGTGINPERKTDLRKAARGAARSVLPNATETKIQMTGNARAWRHFFELRGSPMADAEIRELAVKIWLKLSHHSPNIFGDYTVVDREDRTFSLETPYRKV